MASKTWTEERKQRFQATMAAKRAAGWEPAKPYSASGEVPLHAIKGKRPAKKRKYKRRAKTKVATKPKSVALPVGATLHLTVDKKETVLPLRHAFYLYLALKEAFEPTGK